MSTSHPSKNPNSSRYPSLHFRPSSKGSFNKRPATSSSARPYSPPSPTAPVFVVSRRVAETPEPVQPKTAHRQSFSNISNWALTVEPGTPPPASPVNKSTRSSRRQSTPAIPVSPTKVNTISSQHTMPRHFEAPAPEFLNAPPAPPSEARTGRFRSLGALNPMKRSKSTAPAPKKQTSSTNGSKPITRENIPPALMQELLLMQYTGGGSIETHIKTLMDAQAKQAAKNGKSAGVAGVYRDEEGQVWWDEAEKVEYDSLLGGRRPSATDSWGHGHDEDRHRSRGQDRRRPALQISTPSSGFEDSFVPQTAPIRDAKKRSHVRGMFGMH